MLGVTAFTAACLGGSSLLAVGGPPAGDSWTQTFAEEFTGSTFDRSRWTDRNHETNGSDGKFRWKAYYPNLDGDGRSNVSVSNGRLTITAKRETWHAGKPHQTNYSSGILQTAPLASGTTNRTETSPGFSQRYGYFEARIKGPAATAHGTDAGFWLYPDDGSWPPEINIVEMPGIQADAKVQFNHHYRRSDGTHGDAWRYAAVDSTGWHTYGLLWEPDKLVWYIDGEERYRVTSHVPQKAMFLNMALEIDSGPGDTFFGDRATGVFPQTMRVDWVRVWAASAPEPGTAAVVGAVGTAVFSQRRRDHGTPGKE